MNQLGYQLASKMLTVSLTDYPFLESERNEEVLKPLQP